MHSLGDKLSLPITDPVIVFSIMLLIILFSPLLLNRLRIPGLIGFIVAGVILGPNGFNVLLRDSSIVLFGTVGLLYIMFLAGLEVDMGDFKKNRNKSVIFGSISFMIPMILGTMAGYYLLSFPLSNSILLASMFASHTLITYPIVNRLGVSKNRAVNVTVGGTIIADTAALIVLAVIAGSAVGEINSGFWIQLGISMAIFIFIVLWGFPKIARWFFKNINDGISQYIFVIGMAFAGAFLAEVAGIGEIVGAFLAGLALNTLIPHTSPLMNRTEFVGNSIFIPVFLIGVGMLVDLRGIFNGIEAVLVAITMIILALTSKWVSAWVTQKIFGYTSAERGIIFGLSNSRAAATLAIVLVGYNLEILDENVLNGTVLMILVTCLVSSFATEKAGRELAIAESEKRPDLSETPEKILVPISNPDTIERLIDLAILIKNPASKQPVYALEVIRDDHESRENVLISHKMLEKAVEHAAATNNEVRIITRVDLNVANGILRAVKENVITEIIIGWNARLSARDKIFGSVLDNVLKDTDQMLLVTNIVNPLNTVKRIRVMVPRNAQHEIGYYRWIRVVKTLSKQLGASVEFMGSEECMKRLESTVKESKPEIEAKYIPENYWRGFLSILKKSGPDDLLVVISAREGTISHEKFLDRVPATLSRLVSDTGFIVLYPAQHSADYFIGY